PRHEDHRRVDRGRARREHEPSRHRRGVTSRAGVEEWPEMGKDEVAARLAALIAERLQTVVV
ncbi:hypothetical protein EOA25_39635, partial [Mesorhizobium sp. M2A.F.Ca.ET.040.01.1.1]